MLVYVEQAANVPCAPLCERTGYQDDWQAMTTLKTGKLYLSACVCIQLLKIIKFVSALIPKFGLAPLVLKKVHQTPRATFASAAILTHPWP